jgi:hypothetical protein
MLGLVRVRIESAAGRPKSPMPVSRMGHVDIAGNREWEGVAVVCLVIAIRKEDNLRDSA